MSSQRLNMKDTKYLAKNYLYKGRWISYWYQLEEAMSLGGVKSILEVGVGNKIVSEILLNKGYAVKTVDIDQEVKPDFIEDIRNPVSLSENSFDLILCCQVLEHLPYSDFITALKNLYRISKRYAIITLPYTSKGTFKFYFYIHVPTLGSVSWAKLFNLFSEEHVFNGQHYWEIGKKGYKLKRVRNDICESGFRIIKQYPISENPYHYMFICEKQNEHKGER